MMTTSAEPTQNFDALEAQARRLVGVFMAGGYSFVAPAIIQPAGLLLDVVGEDLRARTYVFNDADGNELCLRPDLTVPTCRLYLERHPDAKTPARLCYNGPAFRYRPIDAPKGNPREFRQAGLEAFAIADREQADAEIVTLLHEALGACGVSNVILRTGDLGVLSTVLDAIAMPERWRQRLRQQFWRPDVFRRELRRLATNPGEAAALLPGDLAQRIDPDDAAGAEKIVTEHLDSVGLDATGARRLAEVSEGVRAIVADARAKPLHSDHASLIEAIIGIHVPLGDASNAIAAVAKASKVDVSFARNAIERRLKLMRGAGVDLAGAEFSGEFGRKFEYYTGFVFELEAQRLGRNNPVAGGGRYDGMMEAVGAPSHVPAVGAAIYTERLLLADAGGAA